MSIGLPGATRRDVVVEGVRFALHRAEPTGATDGPPVLLLHGVPETSLMWRDLLPELVRDRVVLAPDLKGLGGSEARGPYDVSTLVRELVALVRHEVGGDGSEVDVVGHDWGGTLATVMATRHPELVRRLVVINAPYRHVDYLRAWHMLLFSVPGLPEGLFRMGGEHAVDLMLRGGWRSQRPLHPEIKRHYQEAYADPERVAAMLAYYRAATRPRIRGAVERLVGAVGGEKRPGGPSGPAHDDRGPRGPRERVLVVWGARDPVLPLPVGEAVVRDLGSRTELVTVPGAGHFVVEEASDVVVPTVADFLRRPGPSPEA